MRGKKNGKHGRLLSGVIGAVFGFVILLLLDALLSGVLLNERIGEGMGTWIVYGVHVIAVFLGAEMAKRVYGNAEVRITGIASGMYIVIVLICGLILEGSFQNIGLHSIAICAGFLLSCALCIRKSGSNRKKKKSVW